RRRNRRFRPVALAKASDGQDREVSHQVHADRFCGPSQEQATMNRIAYALVASPLLALVVAAPAARAADPFGVPGDVIVGGNASYTHTKVAEDNETTDEVLATSRVDFVIAPRWFLGVTATAGRIHDTVETVQADGSSIAGTTTSWTLGVGARV